MRQTSLKEFADWSGVVITPRLKKIVNDEIWRVLSHPRPRKTKRLLQLRKEGDEAKQKERLEKRRENIEGLLSEES